MICYRLSIIGLMAVALLVGVGKSVAIAQTGNTCIALRNSWHMPPKDASISLEIAGYPDTHWTAAYGDTIGALLFNGQPIRGASFTVQVYYGTQGASGGPLIAETILGQPNPSNILWAYVPPGQTLANAPPECASTGTWLLYVYD
ncbi:MAG TPA: hypothetical protein VNU97_01065 [Rhizomicrobium sp.]|jgi:hypothetical protein|nr:hypothetical protein [Rhizomicrobium sp.]